MSSRYDRNLATKYSIRDFRSTDFLAFRDLPNIIGTENRNLTALDYGCGTGRSTRFLKEIGYCTLGLDTNLNMLLKAVSVDPSGPYIQIKSPVLPIADNSLDLILTSFVLLEIPSKIEILEILIEFNRVMKTGGTIVIIVNTEVFYRGNWVSCDVNFPENRGILKSGQNVRVRLIPENIVLSDYFWSDQDYKELVADAGLKITKELRPLGSPHDNIKWQDEIKIPPHTVYILGK